MLDFGNMMKALPEVTKMLPQVQEFIVAWTQFMARMGEKLNRIEATCEASDNKLSTVIQQNDELDEKLTLFMSETNLTQDLQDQVERQSWADPRNSELKAAWEGENGVKVFFPAEFKRQNSERFP